MPSVDIEGIGTVEFDDGMSQEDISSAIEKDIIPRHQKGIDLRSQLEGVRGDRPLIDLLGGAAQRAEWVTQGLTRPVSTLLNAPAATAKAIGLVPEAAPLPYEEGKPVIPVPKAEDVASFVRESPFLSGTIAGASPELSGAAVETVGQLATPENLPFFGLGEVSPTLRAAALSAISGSMAGQVPQAAAESGRLSVEGTPQEQALANVRLGLTLAGAGAPLAAPAVEGAVARRRIQPERTVPDAIPKRSAEAVPVGETPGGSGEVGARAPAEEKATTPQEEVSKAPAQDVLGALKPEAAKWEQQAKEALTGGLTQKAYDAGLAIENEADLASNREALAKLTKDRSEALERGDVDTGMRAGMQEQFLNEAHQAATGTKSGGQRQFELDPEYKPKFPQGEETLKAWRDAMEERRKRGEQVPASEPEFGTPEEAKPTDGKSPPVEELPPLKVGNKTKRVFQVKESFYNPDDEGTYKPGDKIYDTQLIRAGFKLPEAKVAEAAKVEPTAAPAAKVEAEVAKVARTEGRRPAKEIKNEMVKQFSDALKEAPSEFDAVSSAVKKIGGKVELNADKFEQQKKALYGGKQIPQITIEIPGDGTFTVFNTKEALEGLLKKAKRLSTAPTEAPTVKTRGISKEDAADVQKILASPEPVGAAGPGAKAAGEPPYRAIQQLTDQLNATAPAGAAERLKAGEKIAEQWSQGKSLVDRATARMRNITETLKATARGVREVTDLDRAVAELDATLQQSSGESTNAKKALQRQMPNEFDRSAAAMSIEPASSPEILKEALKILPERTSAKVRRMLERAANPTQEMRQYAESLKQFFGIREQDAMQADLFQDGIRDYYTHVWGKEENMPDSLRGAFNSGRVSTYFQFARQRKIPTILEGIMEGKTPILDPAEVVPFYNYAMDRAIAGREFVRRLTDLDEKDGRPTVIVSGEGTRLEAGENRDPAILIKPKLKPEEFGDYKVLHHPAMQKWKWLQKTDEGDVFMKGELVVHPDAYERIARMMDRDRLAPGPKMRAALRVGSEVKGMKLGGLPSLFHPLHLATHGLAHWTNVFKTEPIQWDAPATRFALEKGHLKLAPNPAELNVFAEGMAATGLAQKIPIIGQWNKAFSHWLFEDWIPRLKLKTFENAYARAQWMKKNLGFFKGLTDEQIAARTGDSVNNAYGELNHLFLGKMGRDPRVQRGLSLAFLAPDFGEARLRFVEKIFTRYGHEERIAALTLAATLYTAARVANYLSHGNAESDDLKNAFRVKVGKHWWTMRSVLGDAVHAYDEPGQFTYVRLSPLYSRTASDFLWGRDPRSGRKLTRMDKVENIAKQLVPIPLSGLTQEDRTFMEGFLQSMGVSNIRDTPVMDVQKLATQWRQSKGLDAGSEFIPSEGPSYWKLRTALNLGRTDHASSILSDLRKTHSDAQIAQAMNTWARHPYTGSMQHEAQFLGTLTPPQHQLYQKARSEQMATLQDFYRLMAAHSGQLRSAQQPNRDLEILRSMAR